jgi:hypothetical protein
MTFSDWAVIAMFAPAAVLPAMYVLIWRLNIAMHPKPDYQIIEALERELGLAPHDAIDEIITEFREAPAGAVLDIEYKDLHALRERKDGRGEYYWRYHPGAPNTICGHEYRVIDPDKVFAPGQVASGVQPPRQRAPLAPVPTTTFMYGAGANPFPADPRLTEDYEALEVEFDRAYAPNYSTPPGEPRDYRVLLTPHSECRRRHKWETARSTGHYLYQECRTCHYRRVRRAYGTWGYQPIDRQWLKTGDWTRPEKLTFAPQPTNATRPPAEEDDYRYTNNGNPYPPDPGFENIITRGSQQEDPFGNKRLLRRWP